MSCVFCHKEQIATDIVYEDEMVIAFMDKDPINEGHVLLATKESLWNGREWVADYRRLRAIAHT